MSGRDENVTSAAEIRPSAHGTIWSDYSTDRFMAPEMSKFTCAEIPDMSDIDSEQDYWLANYILNSILGAQVPSPLRQQWFNFLRRCHSASYEYVRARESTIAFLADRQRQLRYLDAIGHWEAFLTYSWQAYGFLAGGKPLWFKSGDGSVLERLHGLQSRVKHSDEAVARGDIVDEGPLCIWMTNEGVRSTDMVLSWGELAKVLHDLATWASTIQNPGTLHEKLAAATHLDDLSE